MERQEQELKQKDDEIARSKEESKRLNARLSQISSQSNQSTEHSSRPTDPSELSEMAVMRRTLGEQTTKLSHQRSQLASLHHHNARYKELLVAAGISIPRSKGAAHGGQSSDVGGEDGGQGSDKPTWKEDWENSRQTQSLETAPTRQQSTSGSRTSSVLVTPMIEKDDRYPSETSRRSGSYNFKSLGSHGSTQTDPRSDWERSVTNGKIDPSSAKSVARVPTGPRHPSVKVESGSLSQPRYTSENGWGDYYSKDGFGGVQADRLDFE